MNPVKKRLGLALGVALAVSVGFFVATNNAAQDPAATKPATVEFTDEVAGFSVSYPSSWQKLTQSPPDPLVRLLVGPPATDDTLQVRVIELPGTVVINSQTPPEEIAEIQASLDQIIDHLPGLVEVVDRNRIILSGTPGWYYIYKFKDGDEQGIHTRYFMFEGDKEYIVTFQAFPEDHYADLASIFDDTLGTFNFKIGSAATSTPTPTSVP